MENATSAPGASLIPDGIGAFTAAHLTIIAILAVLTVIAIVYGAKLRRDRRAAERERIERQEEMEAQAPTLPRQAATPAPSAPPPPPPPAADEAIPANDPMASEPIPAAGPLEDNPAVEAVTPEPGPASGPEDGPVTQLKGLGPKVAARLAELGITTVGQIAALDADAAARLDTELGAFRGRMARDRWIEQARFLAAGDRAGFEAVFGKL
ncbi:putative flap endonuclease-1-like 5' DNA nuclease [Sphingomonas jinjuensis]|uniref:Putative flap endonuclease-1-like 5' DNA nuclease n=1 Tax=Sphingomonas jinjuensis TaxID=535907 RepID=A0A840EZD6_9SPHN|nr:hypothetical protein [Sphingomonas jinjuensis]MBB4152383.1 putative flap endonuclease-1-like 5' DNA nuclease [Sphingomonas jinjuensis]